MYLEHLRTLVSIVEQGSLSAAARARHISQPAVTKQVQRMETELGVPLLMRGPRRQVELTPAGERVLIYAYETLDRFEILEHELAALKTVGEGLLVIAASTTPGEHVLPGLLVGFRAIYPQVNVRMTVSDSSDVATQLLAETADVGVVGATIRRPGLRLEPLLPDRIVLAMPSDHPFAERTHVSVGELRGQPLIQREEGSGTRRTVEEAMEGAGYEIPRESIILTLGSSHAVLQAVGQGFGIGFISERATAQAQADGRIVCADIEGVDLRRYLYLAYLPSQTGDPVSARFLYYARAQFAEASQEPAEPTSPDEVL